MNEAQITFDELMEKYNSGIEPLENWTTADIVKLIDAADTELQNRAPPDSSYDVPTGTIESDDDY
jgi:hypothetical protein